MYGMRDGGIAEQERINAHVRYFVNINKNKITASVTEISKLNTSFFPKW